MPYRQFVVRYRDPKHDPPKVTVEADREWTIPPGTHEYVFFRTSENGETTRIAFPTSDVYEPESPLGWQ